MSAPAGIWGQTLADADDLTLLSMVRDGDPDAYAELWRRHLPAAYAVAHRHRGRTSAEDIVAEASLRVYDLIRAGKGPMTNFRSYFLTTVRSSAVDAARTELRAVPTEDAALEAATPSSPAYDASASVDHDLVRAAFKRLPERDQQILWHTAVEGVSPAAVGTSMGISANGVSVLALRARDSLRAKYLDAHADRAIGRADDDECRWVLAQMGRYVRGKLPVRQRARVEEHLASCLHARGLAFEMAEVNRALPAVMVPLILLGGSSVAGAWLGAAGAGATASDSPKGPREEPKAALAAAMVANIGGKAAALAVGLVLGVSYVAAPGGLSALGGGGHVSAGVAGSGGNASGAASGSGGADGTLNPSSGSGTTSKVPPDPATTGLPVAPTPSPAPVAASLRVAVSPPFPVACRRACSCPSRQGQLCQTRRPRPLTRRPPHLSSRPWYHPWRHPRSCFLSRSPGRRRLSRLSPGQAQASAPWHSTWPPGRSTSHRPRGRAGRALLPARW
ncbi:MAG: sigma-70 family RNA polymerase sigma factor [Dermatophilaceae bacterium]